MNNPFSGAPSQESRRPFATDLRLCPESLVARLRRQAAERADRGYTYLAQGEVVTTRLSYTDLDSRACSIAKVLAGLASSGDRALLLCPPGLEFVEAFFGCLYAGVIAVPAYPPRSRRSDPRLQSVAADCRPGIVLTTAAILARREALVEQIPDLAPALWVDVGLLGAEDRDAAWEPQPGDIAFLQYTSGSTGTPKGVIVTHENLLHNLEMIRQAFGQTAESVVIGWLPLFHDMGLIGNVLQPCYVGSDCVLMSPAAFLQKPARWLQAIHRFQGTTSGGPNFAYDLCVRTIGPEVREGLDLSSWSTAFNGAEPVHAATLRRFAETFAPCGFRASAFFPCYGLAEATLFVAGSPLREEPRADVFVVPDLESGAAVPAVEGKGRELISCGTSWLGQQIVVVDPETGTQCPDGRVGEILIAGPSVASGYWNRPDATEETFRARVGAGEETFLRTGDLGFLKAGELFLTGRLKDLIIIRGRNLYPHDLEQTAERSHPALRLAGGAAFAVEWQGEERVILVHEVDRHADDLEEIIGAVSRAIAEEHGVGVADIALVRAGTIPKTSSGKIRRRECRARYLAGELGVLLQSARAQDANPEQPVRRLLTRCDVLALDPTERSAALTSWLRTEIAHRAGIAADGLDPETLLAATGLDSLALFDLQARIEADLEIPPFGSPLSELSIASLRDRLLEDLAEVREPEGAGLLPLVIGEELGDHPLSSGQEALWFLENSALEEGVFHIASAARLGAEVDGAALLRAARALMERHPALRTTFVAMDGEIRQRVHAALRPDLEEVDATTWDLEELESVLWREAKRRFDLSVESPLRIRLFTRAGERILLLVLHHLCGDFWSLAVLLRDWAVLQEREHGKSHSPLPELPASYTDFVRWQRRLLAGPERERLERYWLDQLQGAPLVLDLPTDRPRSPAATQRGRQLDLRLDSVVTQGARELARRHGATLFTTLLAAFQSLLAGLTGQNDLLVGSPTTGRRHPELAEVIGYFVNLVPLRADLTGDPPFMELLARARRAVAGALEHRDFPFSELAQRLQPLREPGRPPVFQALFVLQQVAPSQEPGLAAFALGQPGTRVEMEGLTLESLRLDRGTAQLDLTLSAAEIEETLMLSCEYDTDLFDRVTIGRWLRHLQSLLEAAIAHPERRLGELPLLAAAERHQILREWSDTSTNFPNRATIHGLFAEQVERSSAAIAVEQGSETLTYGTLLERAERIARRLIAQGLRSEERVAVLAERSPDLIAILLGILRAGGAYLPLDPANPPERLAWVIRDAGASLLVAPLSSPPAALAVPGLRLVTLDGEEPWIDLPEVPAEALAYVLYTSGSTGTPKGVAVTHRNVIRLVRGADYADMGADQTWLQYAPVSFDASTLEIWAPLLNGGRLVLFPEFVGSLDDLARVLETHRVTSAWLTAGLFHEMVDSRLEGLRPLTQLLAGGDVVSPVHARRVLEACPGLTLIDGYGPTEGTTFTCCHRMTAAQQVGDSVPIGRPIANARVHVLDERLAPVPIGARGELYIGGEGLARGYLNRPDLTAERFVPNPLAADLDEPGGRLYRTGDVTRRLPDGRLEFLGRLDHQVKIRGYRIEIGEIEATLVSLAEVHEAVVVAREDNPGAKRLVAYVVCDGAADALRQPLRARLPEYMVPNALVKLAALPLTANGKVDRQALPAPERASAETNDLAPRTQVEEILADLWAELLEMERPGIHDDFFELGGHSLKAIRLVARIRETFAVDLPLRVVFAAPTVEDMAAAIERALSGMDSSLGPAANIPRVDRSTGRFPLSFAQEQLWFLDRLRPDLTAYNLPAAVRLRGVLSVSALAWALTEVVRRHEALRTRFEADMGGPVQIVEPPTPFTLPMTDLSGLEARRREGEVERLAISEAVRPFDLGGGRLVRAGLLRLKDEEHVLLIALHHIGADAWSLGLFVRELAVLYAAARSGRSAHLPEPTRQFLDFAVWQRQNLQGEHLERLLTFWRGRLEGSMVPLDLPADRVRPSVPSHRGARLPFALSSNLAHRLTILARHAGATPFMAMLAAFAVLLERYTELERLTLGSPVASRKERELEGTIGLLLDTLVFPFDFASEISFSTLLKRTRDQALDAFAHQDLPFPILVEALQSERDLSRNPLFQVFFALQSDPAPVLELPGLASDPVDFDPGTAQFDLALNLAESEGGWAGWLEYSSDLFDRSTVERFAGHLLELMNGLILEPERRVTELPFLSPGERDQLAVWSRMAGDEPREAKLHELIEMQVDLVPDAKAVLFADRTLSYAELDRRANQLARRLLRVGAGPGQRVALCARRSAELVVALLGILKSGAAYIPLDPEYPRERLSFMLADGGPVALILDETTAALLGSHSLPVVRLDDPGIESESTRRPAIPMGADDLAYVIYTSGSTGRPKGVMISHRNLVSFFAGADRRFGVPVSAETCLALTSISFDISVLELLWPLTRGSRVAVHADRPGTAITPSIQASRPDISPRSLAFSLFYFADNEPGAGDKYRLLLEGARFADEHGFEAVWTPERHFHSFGGLYPNPSITSAAVAAVTRRVGIRAGSLVLPLHDPVRVAEDWSMVDNLSGGRVGVSFASGWHADDFIFAPHQYADRRTILARDLEMVRALWRGEAVTRSGGEGRPVEVRIRPRPVQPELPFWITAAGSPETFRQAGEIGANLLTHLLGQTLEELAEKIAVYRSARKERGHSGAGRVTLMLHTFVGEHLDEVRAIVAEPFQRYLRSSVGLLANHARSLGLSESLDSLSDEDMKALLDHAFERYFHTGALLGTPTTCLDMVERLKALDVDEVACLIDFGVPADLALAALRGLAELHRRANLELRPPEAEVTIAAAIRNRGASWLQVTPSMARMLANDAESLTALAGLRRLLLGGEALPEDLALALRQALPEVELHNMYGPTETTVWSTAQLIREVGGGVPIGEPLAGESAVLLDRRFQPVPVGVPGELYLGGAGVACGYHDRPALTAERFVPDPFADQPGARLYRTGDLARRRPDGSLEFLGRVDQQVKVRGHRIEPGEIEVLLRQHPGVAQAVVVARADPAGEASLVAYLVPRRERAGLSSLLPVPAAAELLDGRRQYQLPNGLTVAHLSDYQTADAYREIFRNLDYMRHGIRLEDGACIFDVGANIGLFSLFAHHVCRRPRIYAFEPMPSTFDALRINVALYGLNVTLFNHGIADRPSQAEFTFYPNAPGMSGRFATSADDHRMQRAIVRGWLEETGAAATAPSAAELDVLLADWFRSESVVCPVRTLSEVIAESGVERIDLLKIDAESSEVDVLRGLSAADWPRIRQVVAEVHSPELLAGMRSMLEPRGFEIATEDVALAEEREDGRPIHVVMLYAVLREDGGVSRAMAPWTAAPSAPLSTTALRAWLGERLPDFMIPSAFVTLDSLPLTPNGKIDRRALPAPDGRRPTLEATYVAPSSAVEERIAEIWQEVLGLDRVGMHDNFFELGGSSLSLVQVRTALSSSFGANAISLVDMFRNPTVAALAARLTSTGDARVVLDEVEDRGRQQADALRQGASAVQRQRDFLAGRRQRREALR